MMRGNRATIDPPPLSTMIEGMAEWQNIQDVVRITFQALYDVVKAQAVAIRDHENQLNNKAEVDDVQRSFDDMTSALRNRATIKAVNSSMDKLLEINESRAAESRKFCEEAVL